MKIKVCYLVSSLCNEGPVNVIYNIIRYINFKRFDVSVITFIPEKTNTRIDEFRRLPIEIHQLNKDISNGMFVIYKQLKVKLAEINPDELHAHCPRSLYLLPFLSKQYKKLYTIHIYPGKQQLMLYGKFKGRIVITLNHIFTRMCDKPIGCSENIGMQYKQKKGWHVECVSNGCSMPIWKTDEQEKELLRQEFGLKKDVRYFIFIGRFSKEKNPDILVDVFNYINRQDVGLIMLGDGIMWKDLKRKAGENIIMPGFTNRVYDYLKASDYYISLSDVEGLANTLLESMSVGLPMLLSDIPSHNDVLAGVKYEIAGYVVKSKDIHEICRFLDKILLLDTEKVKQSLGALYTEKYTAQIMSEHYQNIYERVNME